MIYYSHHNICDYYFYSFESVHFLQITNDIGEMTDHYNDMNSKENTRIIGPGIKFIMTN